MVKQLLFKMGSVYASIMVTPSLVTALRTEGGAPTIQAVIEGDLIPRYVPEDIRSALGTLGYLMRSPAYVSRTWAITSEDWRHECTPSGCTFMCYSPQKGHEYSSEEIPWSVLEGAI